MGGLLDAALGFPAVVFTFALLVVLAYWVLVLVGGAALDLLDGDADVDVSPEDTGILKSLGLEGVPLTILLSLFVLAAWFASIVGVVVLESTGLGGLVGGLALLGILVAAALIGLVAARLGAAPLRRIFHHAAAPSRSDFVGKLCVVRTSTVAPDFGQAEITSKDGSTALIQVRQTPEHAADSELRSGSTALIYDYDGEGEFFWVCPVDPSLGHYT
ncbi:OB-fold-containig protein [Lolliginicoccus levis]|uniref:OB-fold-containig protein n=1 Tax=Lolliginicoccus levis TaxID=2919542 RepID=UPI00241F4084|nr:OB-fold-containig protein [Lolliginicoccus levis]